MKVFMPSFFLQLFIGLFLSVLYEYISCANDIDMLKIAGIGIAFNAKPILQTVADISLNSRNLDLALYLIDLTESELADI